MMIQIYKWIAAALVFATLTLPASAQGLFDAVVTVNGEAVTQYEINQRANFLRLSRQSGNLQTQARKVLIEDRLKMAAARKAGIRLSETALEAELESFAQRSGQTFAQLSKNLAREGVDAATLRDFVQVGVTWREVVRSRFAGRGEPSAAEIDRASAASGPSGGLRVLLSEIILPARPGEEARAERNAKRLSQLTSTTAFSNEARRLSVSQSRAKGGRLDWMNLNDLPAPLRPILTALKPGQVSAPLNVQNAVILFQLRGIEETTAKAPAISAIEYAQVTGPANLVALANRDADVCDDLYGITKRNPALTLDIQSRQPSKIPTGLSVQLAVLDRTEKSILDAGNGAAQMLMVCGRVLEQDEDVSREDVTASLRSRRLNSLADGYLAELRSSAVIVNN